MKRLIKIIPLFLVAVLTFGFIYVDLNSKYISASSGVSDRELPLIVLDAGHGGFDGGAESADGTSEQDINLDITLKINSFLKTLGYRTLLTRRDKNAINDSDAKTIHEKKVSDIHNRLKIIESNPGCIFVSIHLNYFTDGRYYGTQVFFSDNNEKSQILADSIQQSVITQLQPENTRKIKPAGKSIYVLYHATEPSVLVECGFLSNTAETEKLKNDEYRMKMAVSVSNGIIQYINTM